MDDSSLSGLEILVAVLLLLAVVLLVGSWLKKGPRPASAGQVESSLTEGRGFGNE